MNINNSKSSNYYANNSKLSFGKREVKLPNSLKMPDTLPAEALVFPLLCGYHAYEDYKKAPVETKKETLVMRLFVLAGTSIGAYFGHKGFEKALEDNTSMKQISKDIVSTIGVPLGGILGGFVSGSFAEGFCSFVLPPERKTKRKKQESRYPSLRFLHKKKDDEKGMPSWLKKLGVISTTIAGAVVGNTAYINIAKGKEFQESMYTKKAQKTLNLILLGVGALSGLIAGDLMFDKEQAKRDKKTLENADFLLSEMSSTVSAFDSVAENDIKHRVEKGFYGIVSSVIVPSAIVLPTLYYLKNYIKDDEKFDKQFKFMNHLSSKRTTQKVLLEKSISVPLSIATYFAGDYVGNWVDEKLTKRFMEQKFWKELETRKQKAIEESMKSLQNNDDDKLRQSLEELAMFEKMDKEARTSSNSS